MEETKYTLKKQKENVLLKSGKSCHFDFTLDEAALRADRKLFFSCEDASWAGLKNESGAELLYMLIDDSLNSDEAEENNYCLDLSCQAPRTFAKRTLRKILWHPLSYGLFTSNWVEEVYSPAWTFGVYAKTRNLKIEDGGYLHIRVDKWLLRDGVHPKNTIAPPDETLILDVPEGTYEYTKLTANATVGKHDTACVIFTVEGERYSGEVYLERPFFTDAFGNNLLPDFDRASIGIEHAAWFGQNLMKREWPRFRIEVNGKTCFDGEVFLKLHRFSPIEIALDGAPFHVGDNRISITYFGDYVQPLSVRIDEVCLLESAKKPFDVVHLPRAAVHGAPLRLLVEAECEIAVESDDFSGIEITSFDEWKFKVVTMVPTKKKNGLTFTVRSAESAEEYTVARCVEKFEDHVIVGSGDMIYVDVSDEACVRDYLKWYVANNTGNLLTIRQVYRWGGQRCVNPRVWAHFTAICEKLGIRYVLISDGRDVPTIATNPSHDMLAGDCFLGKQLHERDGQLFYWDAPPKEIQAPLEEFYDLAARLGREHPDTVEGAFRPFNIDYSGAGYSFKRKCAEIPDVRVASQTVARELRELSGDQYLRHTGPSVTFKYFYENGFDWCGAETMDGATETLLSFLRGASSAYGKNKTGVHLALQWSTFPHDTEQRFRRYFLSLAIPYMHGVTDVNTEEGLWFMEAYYAYHNRLSDACRKNRRINSDFNDFVATHSRTGKFHTPIALIHGNLDGWNGFSGNYSWGMPSMPFGEADESWRLMKIFYPQNTVCRNGCADTGAIFESNDKPCGVFSGTPLGCVDAVPAESNDLSRYSLLVFAGYNCMTDAILARIDAYVKDGGRMIATWAHFADTTHYADLLEYNLHVADCALTRRLAAGEVRFVSDTADGKKITVCKSTPQDARVIKRTDSGTPLVFCVDYGNGEMIFVNTLYYPGNEAVFPIYEETVRAAAERALADEAVKVTCGTDVQYTVYLQDNGTRSYYFTALDWYRDPKAIRKAELTLDGHTYALTFSFGELVKLLTDTHRAVWPKDPSSEVLELTATAFKVQGVGTQAFLVAENGTLKEYTVDFGDAPVATVSFV